LYPTAAVRDQFAPAFPHLLSAVRTYAVDDNAPLTNPERTEARAAFAIPDAEPAVCLVGGWWPYKDIATIDAALTRLRHRLHLLVTGAPWKRMCCSGGGPCQSCVCTRCPAPVSEQALRGVYAAADAALDIADAAVNCGPWHEHTTPSCATHYANRPVQAGT
jgi:hypothetical protein